MWPESEGELNVLDSLRIQQYNKYNSLSMASPLEHTLSKGCFAHGAVASLIMSLQLYTDVINVPM